MEIWTKDPRNMEFDSTIWAIIFYVPKLKLIKSAPLIAWCRNLKVENMEQVLINLTPNTCRFTI